MAMTYLARRKSDSARARRRRARMQDESTAQREDACTSRMT
jgi:hypothetical protein